MDGCDGGDIAVRRGKALACLSGSNGIEGEDFALEQPKRPLERGGELPRDRVKLRVWYGRGTAQDWEPWPEWDGFRYKTGRDQLSNPRTLQLFKEPS